MASWKVLGLLVCMIAILQLAVAEVDVCHWNGETFEKKTVSRAEIAAEMCGGSILPWTRRGCVDYDGNCNVVSYVGELCLAQEMPGHYACQENQLVCVPGPAPCEDDSSCNDHNACTIDTCTSPDCLHTGVVCPGVDQCHAVAACDPLTGCPAPTVTEGATCNDGDACTENDQCQSDGTCHGTPKTCAAPADECAGPGHCEAGECVYDAPLAVNTVCDDNDLCTATSSCDGSGACVGSNPVVCTASDQCHDVGTCNPSTGQCSDPLSAVNTPCNDQSCDTVNDVCDAAGQCAGTACSLPHATPDCSNLTACAVGQCDAGYGNCNAVESDGCETDLQTSEAHCGVCNNACAVDHECWSGACVYVKSASYTTKIFAHTIPNTGLFDFFTAVKADLSSTEYSNSYLYYSMSQTKSDGTSVYSRFCYAHASIIMESYTSVYSAVSPPNSVQVPHADFWHTFKSFVGTTIPWSSPQTGDTVAVEIGNFIDRTRFLGRISRTIGGMNAMQIANELNVDTTSNNPEVRIFYSGSQVVASGSVTNDVAQSSTLDLRAGTDKLSVCGFV